jgi:rod shape-determining protein MreD
VDFLVIAAMLAAVRLRPGVAAVLGLALGLAADSLSPATFGSGGLALTLVAYGASYLKAVYFADNAALSALFVFAGKWIFDIVSVVSARTMRGTELLVQVLLWSPLAATLTALTALLLFFALRPLIGRAAA